MNDKDFDERILAALRDRPGLTALNLAKMFRRSDEDLYDCHRRVSWSIARLRRNGSLVDVERCPVCHRALTRNHKNVPLYPQG